MARKGRCGLKLGNRRGKGNTIIAVHCQRLNETLKGLLNVIIAYTVSYWLLGSSNAWVSDSDALELIQRVRLQVGLIA